MKLIALTALIFTCLPIFSSAEIDLSCLERVMLKRVASKAMMPVRIMTLGIVGRINVSTYRGTLRAQRVLESSTSLVEGSAYGEKSPDYKRVKRFTKKVARKIDMEIEPLDMAQIVYDMDQNKELCPRISDLYRRHFDYRELRDYTASKLSQ